MKVTFWGTRGSIPTPSTTSFQTSRYGGDTTCVSLEIGGRRIIIDGGSGLRLLGLELSKKPGPCHATFLFTHVHWDHIQGFPFFIPAFKKGNSFDLYGPALTNKAGFVGSILEKALRGQQQDLNFPVQLTDMPAAMHFHDLMFGESATIQADGCEIFIDTAPLNHPGGCIGYRIEERRPGQKPKIFAFCTDTEHYAEPNPNVQKLAKDADVMVYDAQYTPDEYNGNGTFNHIGWGHSTWECGLKEATLAGARKLLLTHHDPLHDDSVVSAIEEAAQAASKGGPVEIMAACQFLELEI
jgi:phosphoribosyl 1,2-cyclic phosphodiesterase